jgi:hypothetical protein
LVLQRVQPERRNEERFNRKLLFPVIGEEGIFATCRNQNPMRLGQLARKLALRPSQIVDYLAGQQIFPDEGSNARLTDEMTEHIVLHFAPQRLNEIMTVEETTPELLPALEPVQVEPIPNKIEEVAEVETAPSPAIEVAEDKPLEDKPEVIKAPKVELSGLKVLGKIELPAPKKKTAPVTETQEGTAGEETEKIPVVEKKSHRSEPRAQTQQRRDNFAQRPARNPIALQREQKAREEQENRKTKRENEKEKRTQYYLQRVKTGQPTKAAKIVSEPLESFHSKEMKPAPKTWLGKFLRWLNT